MNLSKLMNLFTRKKELVEVEEDLSYEAGFVSLADLHRKDVLTVNLDEFKKVSYRVMCTSNNDGDSVEVGTLIGFQHFPCGNMHPVVRLDDGKEIMYMGLVFPLWPELKDFLSSMTANDRFWRLASILHGWNGLNRLDRTVWTRTRP